MQLSGEKLADLLLREYVENHSLEVGLKPKTVYNKRMGLGRFLKWLGNRLLNLENCRSYSRHLLQGGWKPVSVKDELRMLKAGINWLGKNGYIEKSFSKDIPYPKVHRKPLEIVPAELAEKIIIEGTRPGLGDNVESRRRKRMYRIALRFILRTGLRNREARDLRGSDINLENGTYTVQSKSGNIDVMPLPKDMLDEIEKRVNSKRLFTKLRPERLNICLKRGCKRLKVKTRIRAHTLRHIFCTALLKRGVAIQIVSRLMRHSSVEITDRVYSHYKIDDLSRALNGMHPLIMEGLSPEDVFNQLQDAVEATDIKTDSRFRSSIEVSPEELVMKFRLVL